MDAKMLPANDSDMLTVPVGHGLTAEQEVDAYKEKIVHMKMVIKELQQSLHSQKIQKDGVETVSVLLREARQQIITLENQKGALETAVRNLQNRLSNSGLSNSVTCDENELFIPGTSKQILDNLAKENARLRNLIGMGGGMEDISRLQEAVEKANAACANLEIERNNLRLKVSDLENTLKISDSEKDKVISRFREHTEKLQSNCHTQDVMCQVMGGEVTGLRNQLKDVVLQCKQLELKLEDVEKAKERNKEVLHKREESSDDIPDGNILLEENSRLKTELKTLKEMNRRWQDYNSDRERYTQELNSKYRELELRYKNCQENQITEERERSLNKLLVTAREKLEKMAAEKQKVEDKYAEQEAAIQALTSEVQRLKLHGGDPETFSALKAQIQVCTEDFETERRDRAAAQAKVHQQKEEILAIKKENEELRYKIQSSLQGSQLLTPRQLHPYVTQKSVLSEVPQLQARGWSSNQVGRIVTDGDQDVVDEGISDNNMSLRISSPQGLRFFNDRPSGPVSLPVMRAPDIYKNLARKKTEDTLCCPKCSQGFSEQEHDKLLEHMEVCCE